MARFVTLRTGKSTVCKIPCGKDLQRFAMRWTYIVRQRHRWSKDVEARQRQAERLQSELGKLGVRRSDLKKLVGIVEVSIPYSTEKEDWEARILPWEYVLAAATGPLRGGDPILIVRHLSCGRRARRRDPKRLAILESAPGEFRQRYDFAAETGLVRSSLPNLTLAPAESIIDPTTDQLGAALAEHSPDIVHITGIDTRLGRQILKKDGTGRRDGLFFTAPGGGTEEVDAESVAALLNLGDPNPLFVGFNCWDSGSRMAPMAINAGVATAIGFQHTFDDGVAEIFFVNFYRACVETGWDYLSAFLNAWNSISGYRERIRGSSIILWSATSLVGQSRYKDFADLSRRTKALDEAKRTSSTTTGLADPEKHDIRRLVQVSIQPKSQLNYSLLHNGRSLFEEFTFRFNPKLDASAEVSGNTRSADETNANESAASNVELVRDIDVEIQLHVGTDSFPFRTRIAVGRAEPRYDLSKSDFVSGIPGNPTGGIQLPLTSNLIRSVSERVQTSMFVEAKWHGQVLYRHTHPIWLSPIDQWSLTDDDIWWLPSFVQPRDPEVAATIHSAQKYLKCLADWGAAGFDGYQSFDPDTNDTTKQWLGVDQQVRAIWSALAFDSGIHYINPPPSYGEFTQRLRTPSQTCRGHRGTCVDLAVLMASCLEWVEIYPVIFMLDDHAFPGYWRSLEAYEQFFDVKSDNLVADTNDEGDGQDIPKQRWISGRKTYGELKSYVDEGSLVPLETVYMTQMAGFAEAKQAGREYFEKARSSSFHSMIDIASAREGVTPLPLCAPPERGNDGE